MNIRKNVPAGWKRCKFDCIAPLQRGFDLPNSQLNEGPFPVVYSNGIKNYHSEYKVKGPGIVTGRSGTIGKVTLVEDDYWPHNTALWVTDFKGNYPKFIYYLILFLRFEKYLAGSGVPTLNRNDIHRIITLLPPVTEQKAIAGLLVTWDEAIEKIKIIIQTKERQKRSELHSLISSKRANSTIGSFVKPVIRKADKPTDSYLALGIRSHFKGTFQRFIEDPQTVNMDTLYRVKENDLILNITFAWEGAIALVKKEDEKCLVSHRFPTFEIQRTKAEPSFVRHLIMSSRMKYNLSNISPGGAGRNRVLNKKDFLKMPIWLPDLKTQKNIGEYLGTMDIEIDLLKKLLEKYKAQKRGLMQKLLTGQWRIKPKVIKKGENNA